MDEIFMTMSNLSKKGWQDLLCHTVLHDACVPVRTYIHMHFSLILCTYV